MASQQSINYHYGFNPLCDFLFYVVYRFDRFQLGIPVDVSHLPVPERWGHFASYTAFSGTTAYEDLPDLLERYYQEPISRYDVPQSQMQQFVEEAQPHYSTFLHFWEDHIKPLEEMYIAGWREEVERTDPLAKLQQFTRLNWQHDDIHLWVSYPHPSASALIPYPHIFESVFRRDKAWLPASWFIGHEGTHILLNNNGWADWLKAHDLEEESHTLEEGICFLFQNRLAVACGVISENQMQTFTAEDEKRYPFFAAYNIFQKRWDDYVAQSDRYATILDLTLEVAETIHANQLTANHETNKENQ